MSLSIFALEECIQQMKACFAAREGRLLPRDLQPLLLADGAGAVTSRSKDTALGFPAVPGGDPCFHTVPWVGAGQADPPQSHAGARSRTLHALWSKTLPEGLGSVCGQTWLPLKGIKPSVMLDGLMCCWFSFPGS